MHPLIQQCPSRMSVCVSETVRVRYRLCREGVTSFSDKGGQLPLLVKKIRPNLGVQVSSNLYSRSPRSN